MNKVLHDRVSNIEKEYLNFLKKYSEDVTSVSDDQVGNIDTDATNHSKKRKVLSNVQENKEEIKKKQINDAEDTEEKNEMLEKTLDETLEKVDETVNDESKEDDLDIVIQNTTNNLSITKKELLKKNPNDSRQYVDCFRSYVNGSYGNSPSYQIRNSLKKFNAECDKIVGSKRNVQNYRKSMINTMEVFLNEIINFQKHNNTIKTKKRKNGNL